MLTLTQHLSQYAAYHRDRRNIATHFVGIPLIVFAVIVLLSRPAFHWPADGDTGFAGIAGYNRILPKLDLRWGGDGYSAGAWRRVGHAVSGRYKSTEWLSWGLGLFLWAGSSSSSVIILKARNRLCRRPDRTGHRPCLSWQS